MCISFKIFVYGFYFFLSAFAFVDVTDKESLLLI